MNDDEKRTWRGLEGVRTIGERPSKTTLMLEFILNTELGRRTHS